MWFKGLSFLSYTALLVTPTNAAFRGRGVVHNGRNQLSARRHNTPYLQGRQQPWKNETRPSVTSQEPESTVLEPVVIVTSDPQVTSTEIPAVESSSAVITEEPASITVSVSEASLLTSAASVSETPLPTLTAPVSEAPLLTSTAPVSEAPLPTSTAPVSEALLPTSTAPVSEKSASSSDVVLPKPSSSAVEEPVVSDPVLEPAPVTSVVSSSSFQATPSATATPTSEPISTSSAPLPTFESIIDPIAEPQSSTTALLPTSSSSAAAIVLIQESSSIPISSSVPAPIEESSKPVPERTSALLPSPSISALVEELSSTVEPRSSAIQPSSTSAIRVPEPTAISSVVSEPAQPEPSSQQQTSSTAEQQPSSTSDQQPSATSAQQPIATSAQQPIATSAQQPPAQEPESVSSVIPTTSAPVVTSSSALIVSILEPIATASLPLLSVPVPEPSITQLLSSTALPQPSDVIATSDGENKAPMVSTISASSLAVPGSSLVLEGPVVPTSTGGPGSEVSVASNTVSVPTGLQEATTSTTGLLPLPSDILAVPSSILSGISSLLSSVLDPSNAVGSTAGPISSVSQTGIAISEETAQTTLLASRNGVQPTSSVSEAQPTPSTTSEDLLPVISGSSSASISASLVHTLESSSIVSSTDVRVPIPSQTDTTISVSLIPTLESGLILSSTGIEVPLPSQTDTATSAPLIPTSESGSRLSSTGIKLPLPSQIDIAISAGISLSSSIPTGITTSGSIPALKSLTLPSDRSTLLTVKSDLAPAQTGKPTPSVSRTRLLPETSLVPSLVSPLVSQPDSTVLIDESNTKGPLTTSAAAVLSPLPSFEVINTAATSSANQTDVPTPTGIPASETRLVLTTPITNLPSTLLPTPGSTTGISGPTNATDISSGLVGSATSGQFPFITGTVQPLPTKVTKEDTQAPIVPIPTSESVTSVTGLDTAQSGSPSPTSGSVEPPNGTNQLPGTSAGDGVPASTGLPADNENSDPSATVPAGVNESSTTLHSSSTTTAAAAAAPPSAPLSKSQTAGIAIGGTTCLLFALVAGLFVARRYHSNAAGKRQSKGVYPEVPPTGDGDAEAGGGIPAMSGGASGYGALSHGAPGQDPYGALPPPMHSPRHSRASAWPADSNEPASGNPFSDPLPPLNHALHLQNVSRHGTTDSTASAWPTGDETHSSVPFLSPIMMPKSPFGNLANHGRTDTTVSAWPAGNQNRSSQDLVTSPVIIPRSTFQNVPKHEPNESTVSAWPHIPKLMPGSDNPFLDPVAPGPQTNSHGGSHGGSVNKEMEEYVSLAVNPYAFNPHAAQYPPMSPYVSAFAAPPASRDSDRYSDPFSDPFEHDLVLNVDMRSETSDSIHLVTAPSPTPRSPNAQGRYTPELTAVTNNSLQPIARVPVGGRSSPYERSYTPDSLAPPRGFTPDGRYTPTPELSSGLSTLNNSPVIGPLQTATAVPMHKGWDDIRSEDQLAMPPPLNLAQPMKTNPIPLRRQPTLAGAGQILLQGPGLPLIVKRKEVGTGMHGQNDSTGSGFGLEVPSMYGSPGPTINDFGGDLDSQRKRSGELMFADPQLVGRHF